jgi:hypothetical protein
MAADDPLPLRADPRQAVCRQLAEALATPDGLRAIRLAQRAGLLDVRPEGTPLSPHLEDAAREPRERTAAVSTGEETAGAAERRPSAPLPRRSEVARAAAAPPEVTTPAASSAERAAFVAGAAGPPRAISIWRPSAAGGEICWERPEPGPFGDHYSTRRRLEPRRGPLPRRVVVLGESVGAGYLYAPHLTAALALAARLDALAGAGAYEVIDLARSNETLAGLAATAEAAMQLAPHLVVVFAGNNWNLLETPEVSPYAPSTLDRQAVAAALGAAGLAGPVGLARRRLDGRVRAALERVAAAARAAGAAVVAVVPEVCLDGWESRQPVAWLPGDGTGHWYRLLDHALAALARGDAAAAEEAAWRMNRLDGSSNPVPFRLLARAWSLLGRQADARDAALAEVDSVHPPLLGFLAAPQATTAARALLADAARRHGWAAVDLRPVFAEHTGSLLPGRRLFLDYCHLTAEAMGVAMAAVAVAAARLAPAPGAPCEASWQELVRAAPAPSLPPEVEATARLGAAIHGAHRLLPVAADGGWIESWCEAALAASPGVATAMAELAAARTMAAPTVLVAAVRDNHRGPYRLGFQHGLFWDGLDGEVLLAAARAARRAARRAGRAEGEEIERRLASVALPPAGVDLAAGSRYLAEPLARFFPEAIGVSARATLRCPWPRTAFWLPVAGPGALTLRLTARLPAIPGVEVERAGRVRLEVAGRAVGEVALAAGWSRSEVRLPAGALSPGLHRLTLHWPPPPPVGEAALEGARRRLELGVEADLHPVFGEVAALRLAPG